MNEPDECDLRSYRQGTCDTFEPHDDLHPRCSDRVHRTRPPGTSTPRLPCRRALRRTAPLSLRLRNAERRSPRFRRWIRLPGKGLRRPRRLRRHPTTSPGRCHPARANPGSIRLGKRFMKTDLAARLLRVPFWRKLSFRGSPAGLLVVAVIFGFVAMIPVGLSSIATVGGVPVSMSGPSLAHSVHPDTVSRLVLTEAFTLSVPDSFAMEGLVASAHSATLLAWSGSASYVLVYSRIDDDPPKAIGNQTLIRPIGAAFTNNGEEAIEVIDAGRRMVSTFSLSGEHLSDIHLRVPVQEVLGAARGQEGWFLAGNNIHGVCRLYLQSPDGDAVEVSLGSDLWVPSRTGCTHGTLLITALSRGSVLVSRRDEPFHSQQADPGGSPNGLVFRPPREALAQSGDPGRLWRALPIVELDRGYLQTVADLRSDRRVIVRFDEVGTVVRIRTFDLPIGFVTSVPAERLIIGARRIGGVEIVGYVWRWNEA